MTQIAPAFTRFRRAIPVALTTLAVAVSAAPVRAQAQFTAPDDGPPGLIEARLRPGMTMPDGRRVAALELILAPGWKTYWHTPGEAGVPAQLDWSGDVKAQPVWPAPRVIHSGGMMSLGYYDHLVLPVWLDDDGPLQLDAQIGLCQDVCVLAPLHLKAGAAGPSDPVILDALSRSPEWMDAPSCEVRRSETGMTVAVTLPNPADAVAITVPGRDLWVQLAEREGAGWLSELYDESGSGFEVAAGNIAVTAVGPDGAREARCAS